MSPSKERLEILEMIQNGTITPGDMLVTSSTPGYAMKAGNNPPLMIQTGSRPKRLVRSK